MIRKMLMNSARLKRRLFFTNMTKRSKVRKRPVLFWAKKAFSIRIRKLTGAGRRSGRSWPLPGR